MPNYSDDEFAAKLQGAVSGQTNAPTGDAEFLSKLQAATGSQVNVNAPPVEVSATPSLSFQERNERVSDSGDRIPIDVREGMPMSEYFGIAYQRGPKAQMEAIQNLYPNRKARVLDSGDIAIQITDSKTGRPKDVMINPSGIDAHDLIDLATQTPEIAASMATALATRGTGALKTAAQIILSSMAGGAMGAVRDVAARTGAGIPMDPYEIAKARGTQTALDMFLQTGLLGAGKSLRVLSPFAKEKGRMQFDLERAQKLLKDNYGIDYQLTAGESTGSPALRAIESFEAPQPGARTVFDELKRRRNEGIQNAQRMAVGKVFPEEEIGRKSIEILTQSEVLPIENALQQAREVAISKGQQRVVDLIDKTIGKSRTGRVTPTQAGEFTKESFESRIADAEAKVNEAYAKVNKLPGGSGNVLPGDAAADAAVEIRKELPTVTKEVEEATPILDESGNPITVTLEQDKLLKSGIPEGLLKSLDDLESLRGGKVSLQTLTNMKKAAFDAIAAFKTAHGDVKDRWFNKIAGAYEGALQEAIDQTENIELKTALANARDTYKREIVPLERPGLKELAKDEMDAGNLAPEEIANRFFEGPKAIKNFQMLKEVLGENHQALRVLKRSWVDTKLASVTDKVTGTIDTKALNDVIDDLGVNKPELAQEIFGKNYDELSRSLRMQRAFHSLDKLDENEVRALMNMKDPGRADLQALMLMQRNRNEAYANSFLKDIADGLPIAPKLKPTEFVSRLTNAKTPTQDVEKILSTISRESPETRDAIATATMYRIIDAASVSEAATATRSIAGAPVNLSAKKLAEAMGNPKSDAGRRIDLLLGLGAAPGAVRGATRKEVLEALTTLIAPSEEKMKVFSGAAGLSGGAQVAKLTRDPFQYASSFVKKMALAVIYSKVGRPILTNRAFSPEETAVLANALIAEEPFVRRLVETTGPSTAENIIGELKGSIDTFVEKLKSERNADTPENRQRKQIENVMQGKPASVRIQ